MADFIIVSIIVIASFFILRGQLHKLRSGQRNGGCAGCSGSCHGCVNEIVEKTAR